MSCNVVNKNNPTWPTENISTPNWLDTSKFDPQLAVDTCKRVTKELVSQKLSQELFDSEWTSKPISGNTLWKCSDPSIRVR